jgi:hypothetical protein
MGEVSQRIGFTAQPLGGAAYRPEVKTPHFWRNRASVIVGVGRSFFPLLPDSGGLRLVGG